MSRAARRRVRAVASSGSGQARSESGAARAGFSSSSAGSSAQASISPWPATQCSYSASRKADGPRVLFWDGPHQWPEPRRRERGRVKVT
ncbi:hypothetical protein SCYAM73S_06201 [Streptomyces cyaneofuscatus]